MLQTGWPGFGDGVVRPLAQSGAEATAAWQRVLDAREPDPGPRLERPAMWDLYGPIARATRGVWAHLGQSLDGFIATESGRSRWVTGERDQLHNHRMRALCDAVLVGPTTARLDDPQLTVRSCSGHDPVRVLLDPDCDLADAPLRALCDGRAPTILLRPRGHRRARSGARGADVLEIEPSDDGALDPKRVLCALAERGLGRVFVEGGGRTVLRFISAGALSRLQLVIAPVMLGRGRPALPLGQLAVTPGVRSVTRYALGHDLLFDLELGAP